MKTKTDRARELFESGDLKGALRIASRFNKGLSAEEQTILRRGYECMINPSFYASLGFNPVLCASMADRLFKSKFITSK